MLSNPVLSAGLAVVLIAIAAGLEGSAVPAFGGWALGIGALVGWGLLWGQPLPQPGPRVKAALALLAVLLLIQWCPIPPFLRSILAPGQARAMAGVAPEWSGDMNGWLDALTRFDLEAAVGTAPTWSYPLLVEPVDKVWRPLASHWVGLDIASCWWFAIPPLWLWGMRIGRSETGSRILMVGMLVLGVAEAVFGLANREGPSTGIGVKTFYLGCATGTFVNRGHFAAFLVLCLGCVWGLAASLFPLLPEAARRHGRRRNRSSQPPSVLETAGDKLPRLVLLAFVSAVTAVALVMARSRSPLVSLSVVGALVGLAHWRFRREPLHLGIGLGVPIAGAVLASAAFGLRGSLGRFWSVIWEEDSAISRVQLWREGLSAWLDAPLLGWGPGGWGIGSALHHSGAVLYDFPYAHAEPLQQLVELGGVGFAALGVLILPWIWGLRHALEEEVPARSIGVLVGCGAVLLQSIVDFPLHIPGVLIPFCLLAGMGTATLHRPEVHRKGHALLGICAALALVFGARAALRDDASEAGRVAHVSTLPLVWFDASLQGSAGMAQWFPEAQEQVVKMPLDPWVHMTIALGHSLLASRDRREEDLYAAELSVARALQLRPREPRMLVAAAQIWLRLGRSSLAVDAYQERAVQALKEAVSLDGWRAEAAFQAVKGLPVSALHRIRDGAASEGRDAARVHFEYAEAIAARGDFQSALAACEEAIRLDPSMGPPYFRAGEYARQLGQTEASLEWFRGFLGTSEKPVTMEGWSLYYLGDLSGANIRFNRAVAESSGNRWAWQGLAKVARDRGEPRNERKALERLVELGVDDPRIRARIAELK